MFVYKDKAEQEQFDAQVEEALGKIDTIQVTEKGQLPSVDSVFAGTEDVIDIGSVVPNIQEVDTSTPGEYEVKYNFKDVRGGDRVATVKCDVRPELESHVSGLQNIEIDAGDELPTDIDCQYDPAYINSVTLNTDMVDAEEAGIYEITYTILGTNGDMKEVDGYTCTVNEVAPTPTPTSTPTPSPTPTPKPEKKEEPETELESEPETDAEVETEVSSEHTDEDAVGNVEVQQNVVETGDENNVIGIAVVAFLAIGAAIGVLIYNKKEKEDKEKEEKK